MQQGIYDKNTGLYFYSIYPPQKDGFYIDHRRYIHQNYWPVGGNFISIIKNQTGNLNQTVAATSADTTSDDVATEMADMGPNNPEKSIKIFEKTLAPNPPPLEITDNEFSM